MNDRNLMNDDKKFFISDWKIKNERIIENTCWYKTMSNMFNDRYLQILIVSSNKSFNTEIIPPKPFQLNSRAFTLLTEVHPSVQISMSNNINFIHPTFLLHWNRMDESNWDANLLVSLQDDTFLMSQF